MLKRAQARLNLVSITIFREAHLLDVNECDATTLDAIDVYDWRLRLMPAAEAPIDAKSWAEALPPWRIPTMTYTEIYELREWW